VNEAVFANVESRDDKDRKTVITYEMGTDAHGLWIIAKNAKGEEITAVKFDTFYGDLTLMIWDQEHYEEDPRLLHAMAQLE
jgi:hypothetical protein